LIEKALHTLLKTQTRLIGAGRTDAGVHARGQVAHFLAPSPIVPDQILHALNGILPYDIRIKELTPTPHSFHAQYSALSKEYHYHLWLEKTIDPFFRLYRHHFFHKDFSLPLLKEGSLHFLGTHDFVTFANVGGSAKSTVRTITRLELIEQEGGIRFEFEGNGFLYKMVRNIVSTLLECAVGKRPPTQIPQLFAQKERRAAGPAAPPQGLFLFKINYPPFTGVK
jgi:tRNA pseudouridine38-40 synthase